MKTILYSEIIRRSVQVPNEKTRAKIVEIIACVGKSYWSAREVMVESGLIDKEGAFYPVDIFSGIMEDGDIVLKKYIKGRETPNTAKPLFLSRLIKKPIEDVEGQEIGKVYDFELYAGKKPWMVWKILVNPLGLNPAKRRLRIPTSSVTDIKGDRILLSTKVKGVDK